MTTLYFCDKEQRRERVREGGALNGIDYLEVDHPAQTTLTVTFLLNVGALTKDNLVIEGGVRVRNIQIQTVNVAGKVAAIVVDRRGDFSTYTLRVVRGPADPSPPAGFDGRLCSVDFSFKVQCPSDFDCERVHDCPPAETENVPIDYLAKDYQSFRRLMLDRLSLTMPTWKERNPSDVEMAVVELLAYVGDQLSYYQDSVATEAYLGTARRRGSVRRHARLLDYFMHEGCTARTYVCLEVTQASNADGAVLPRSSVFLDRSDGEGTQVSSVTYGGYADPPVVFESMHDVTLSAARSRISFHTWSDFDCCLPRGAVRATLVRRPGMNLAPGDLLALYEELDPASGTSGGADPAHRHVVRLKTVEPGHDDFENVDVYEVTWHHEDALPFALCLSTTIGGLPFADVSIACANVVLVDHGRTLQPTALDPAKPLPNVRYSPALQRTDVSFASPYSDTEARKRSAARALASDPHTALAQVEVTTDTHQWIVMPDLLRSGPFHPHFVVEIENGRDAHFRFGDGVNGRKPAPNDRFRAKPRVGNGIAGNVGRDALTRLVWDTNGVTNVWNPLPAAGGVEPEGLSEVKEYAPEAFKVQERAVTEADYERITLRHVDVQAAHAEFRWTGSWYTVFLVVDRFGGGPVTADPEFKSSILAHVDRYRMAGIDVELCDPKYVPLEIELHVCVSDGYFRGEVLKRLARIFGAGMLSDGHRAFFHPDNYTFGQSVYLSQLMSAAMSVEGVDNVVPNVFKRWAQADNGEIDKGRIFIGPNEIAQLANDPNLPENGQIKFDLEGGL